ncbi:MAG: hypothetical protein JHC93_00605 [Parachlamydiales bacterium]|nr:hypothetical protein [Parachlamydiales bacterium]
MLFFPDHQQISSYLQEIERRVHYLDYDTNIIKIISQVFSNQILEESVVAQAVWKLIYVFKKPDGCPNDKLTAQKTLLFLKEISIRKVYQGVYKIPDSNAPHEFWLTMSKL